MHYFEGKFYANGTAPSTLRLQPGTHRIHIRLVRDVRVLGGIGEASVDVRSRLKKSEEDIAEQHKRMNASGPRSLKDLSKVERKYALYSSKVLSASRISTQ